MPAIEQRLATMSDRVSVDYAYDGCPIVRTIKAHKAIQDTYCEVCQTTIQRGQTYQHITHVVGPERSHIRACLPCGIHWFGEPRA